MMADEVVTITVRGEGGDIFDMDVPAEGTARREIFEHMVEKGTLTVLSGTVPTVGNDQDEDPVLTPEVLAALEFVDEVPDGNAEELLAWAEDDPERQLAALIVEQADGGKGRKGVIEALTSDLEG